jgi:ADP-heptose:LPS heptosyltransferase
VIGLMSLPGLLGVTVEELPVRAPSAWAHPDRIVHWRERLASFGGLRIGICWTGNPVNKWNSKRSLSIDEFAPLAAVPGVRLFSLQKGFGAEQAAADLAGSVPLVDLAPELTDFAETAAAIRCLDLVISVETAVAHLAGALGAPVWALLAKSTAWMWFTEREDSPWYPTMRLYRQPAAGDWSAVMARVASDLARLATARP